MLFLLILRERYMVFYGKITERMIEMAKVYDFPVKKVQKLPEEIEKRLHQAAKAYVEALQLALP